MLRPGPILANKDLGPGSCCCLLLVASDPSAPAAAGWGQNGYCFLELVSGKFFRDLCIDYLLGDFQQTPLKLINCNKCQSKSYWAKPYLGPWQHFPSGSQAVFLQIHTIILGTAQNHLPKKSENVKLSGYRYFAVSISIFT